MKLLPLGTVIEINNRKACIIGYSSVEKEAVTVCGYFVVSYPAGFTSIEKVVFIPCDSKFQVLAEGYKTKPSERVLDAIVDGVNAAKGVSKEELVAFNRMYREKIMEKKEALEE